MSIYGSPIVSGTDLKHGWGWFLGWGILLTLLGIGAIMATTFTTWVSVITIGAVLLAIGIIVVADSFRYWHADNGFAWHFIMGCLYAVLGILCLAKPMVAAASLTLILATLFIISGIARIVFSQSLKLPGWGWGVVSGILSLVLGILIIVQWPQSSLFIIGLFIGIDLFFLGWAYIMISFLVRREK